MSQKNISYLPVLGEYVQLKGQLDWGIGQVQSVDGTRVIVNFEEAGKQTINIANAELVASDIINDVH